MLCLHLYVLLDLRSSPTVLPSLLSTPVETMTGPSEAYSVAVFAYAGNDQDLKEYAFGGPGGSRTRVQKSFALKGLQQFFI